MSMTSLLFAIHVLLSCVSARKITVLIVAHLSSQLNSMLWIFLLAHFTTIFVVCLTPYNIGIIYQDFPSGLKETFNFFTTLSKLHFQNYLYEHLKRLIMLFMF